MSIFESLIGGTAISIIETAIKGGKFTAKEIRGAYAKVEHEQRLIAAAEAYLYNYQNRHCQIKILPGLMKEPLELEAIYTDVKMLDDRSVRAFMGLDALETAYRQNETRGGWHNQSERLDGMTVANNKPCLMVLGGPGIGKSTFLRKVGLEALKSKGTLDRECIPVFLELKNFREESIDIRKKIVEEFDICNFPAAGTFVDAALAQGKLLVLFDGLDEVPSRILNQVIKKIEDFVDKYRPKVSAKDKPIKDKQNSFVVSCRTAAYRSSFRRFTDITISEFDNEQIKHFIYRWFGSEEDQELETASKYLAILNQSEHRATKELAQTPLLLTFLCLVYDREQTLPNERSTLYGRALNIILNEWAAQKRIEPDPIYKGFHVSLEQVMLAEIAYNSFREDQLFFSKDTITERITAFLTNTLDAPKYLNADAILRAIEIQQGILVERATNAYSFSHLTLQEYLTALHIVENRLETELVTQYLIEDTWREVFLLTAGLMKNRVMLLLEAIDRQARTYIEPYPKLKALIQWAEVNKGGPSELCQRAAVLAVACASASAFASANNSASISARACAIASASSSDLAVASSSDNISTNADIISSFDFIASTVAKAFTRANDSANAIDRAREKGSNKAIDGARSRAIISAIDRAIVSARLIGSDSANADRHHFFNIATLISLSAKLSQHQKLLPSETDSSQDWRIWAEQLNRIWLDTLDIRQESIIFSPSEATALQDYLQANELLLCCKKAAIRVPRNGWEDLEERLLTSY